MANILLLRHGKVDGLPALYGKTDIGVSSEVDDEILTYLHHYQRNAEQRITQVISSPLKRCRHVAEKFAVQNALSFNTNNDFQEMDFGLVDGITFDNIKTSEYSEQTWKQLVRFWDKPKEHVLPEAEPLNAFYQRVEQAWLMLLKEHKNETILLVCHGGVIRMILSYLLQLDFGNQALFSQLNIPNGGVTLVKHDHTINHSKVLSISTPLKCISELPEAFGLGKKIDKELFIEKVLDKQSTIKKLLGEQL